MSGGIQSETAAQGADKDWSRGTHIPLPSEVLCAIWKTITLSRDSHILEVHREEYTARGASVLAKAIHSLVQNGGYPAEEKQEAGVVAVMLARKALEIHHSLRYGAESVEVVNDMCILSVVFPFSPPVLFGGWKNLIKFLIPSTIT